MKYSQYFEVRKNYNEEEFITLKNEAPKELEHLIRDIHENFNSLPNKWIYLKIAEAFDALEYEDPEIRDRIIGELEPDCYNYDLYKWFGNSFAYECILEAIEEGFCDGKDIYNQISAGQWSALNLIYNSVNIFLDENPEQ